MTSYNIFNVEHASYVIDLDWTPGGEGAIVFLHPLNKKPFGSANQQWQLVKKPRTELYQLKSLRGNVFARVKDDDMFDGNQLIGSKRPTDFFLTHVGEGKYKIGIWGMDLLLSPSTGLNKAPLILEMDRDSDSMLWRLAPVLED